MATKLLRTGVALMISAVNGVALTAPTYIGWGTGTVAAAVTDTGLGTASAEARVAGTKSVTTTNFTNDTYQVVGTLTSASAQTVSEAVLFNALTGGSAYVRGVFTGIALAIGDSIAFTITTTITTA